MNVATVRRLLRASRQTCTIRRRAQTGSADLDPETDPYGDPVYNDYADLTTGVLCLATPARAEGELATEYATLVLNRYEFYFAGDEDITEDDRIAELAFAGAVVNDHYFEIKEILRQEPYYLLVIAREVI